MDGPDSISTRRALLASVGTVVAGGGVVYAGSQLGSDPTGRSSSRDRPPFHASSESTGFGIDLSGHPIMGSTDASLEMYYWSDYQCPFCQRFETNTLPKLVDTHVATGTVRVVFIQFPYLSTGSLTAAVMDRCVWRQLRGETPRRYLAWHSAVFDEQGEQGSGWAAEDNLLEVTREVDGVDAAAVESCLQRDRAGIESSISADVDRARRLDIGATPAFIIYDPATDRAVKLVGAQPSERFDTAIAELRNA